MKQLILIAIYTAAAVLILVGVSNFLKWLKDKFKWFDNLALFIFKYSYLILIFVGSCYMIFHEYINKEPEYVPKDLSEIIHGLFAAIFSIGAFSGSIKFASSLKLFKEQYKKIVMSQEFEDLVGKKLDAFAHSTDYLEKLDLNQLKELWKDVTLSKYKNSFPLIYEDLKGNLENELFLKANTSFYYKHFYVEYEISLDQEDNKYVNIKYSTNYTIIRNTTEPFEWSFTNKSRKADYENSKLTTLITIDNYEIYDSRKAEYKEDNNLDELEKKDVILTSTQTLKGKKQYNVKKVSNYRQNLEIDKSLGFGSGRIIDDLFISIKYCKSLDVFFAKSNNNVFDENEDKENRILKYENRNLLLPGEKFRIFLLRPGI